LSKDLVLKNGQPLLRGCLEGRENNVERDGITTSILKSPNKAGQNNSNGCFIFPTKLWETDGLKSVSIYQEELIIRSKTIGTQE